jgi:hypothetical protein
MGSHTEETEYHITLSKILNLFIAAGHKAKIVGDSVHVTHEASYQYAMLTAAGAAIQLKTPLLINRKSPKKKLAGGACDITIKIK